MAEPEQPAQDVRDAQDAQEADSVAELAAALREDPVLVHELLGNGRTAEVDAALTELATQVDVPVFVALVQQPNEPLAPDDPADDLLRLLHQELDEPGLYVVQTPEGIGASGTYDVPLDALDLSLAVHDAGPDTLLTAAGQAALTLRVAAEPDLAPPPEEVRELLSGELWVDAEHEEPAPYELAEVGGGPLTALVVGVAVGLTTLAVAWRALRARRATGPAVRRRGRRPTGTRAPASATAAAAPPSTAELRRRAQDRVAQLRRELRRSRVQGTPRDRADGSQHVAARLAGSEDRLEVVGALVVAAQGLAALQAGAAYRPCFFDPLHGEGTGATDVGGASVPACSRCRRRVEEGLTPEPLTVPTWRGERPYYEGSGTWARTGFGALTDDLWRELDAGAR